MKPEPGSSWGLKGAELMRLKRIRAWLSSNQPGPIRLWSHAGFQQYTIAINNRARQA